MQTKGEVADKYLKDLLERYRDFPDLPVKDLIYSIWEYTNHGCWREDVEKSFVAGYLTALKINANGPESLSKPDLDRG